MTRLYMLDTDTCAFILRRTSQALLDRIQTVPLELQVMSMVTLAELLYGVQISSRKKDNRAAVDALTRHLSVIDWSRDAAEHYADIRADLKKRGQLIGSNDLMIAAHARSLGAIVVTNNEKDFRRVKGLKHENWMD
ncbi:PIN domain-containing protein [Comamonadaceae bacterium G21597-S1]|nr:PIN domain-containing protein [Comamonadaceae bacterium G21597-S1]